MPGKIELDDGYAQLADAEIALAEGKAQLDDGYAQLIDADVQIKEGGNQLKECKKTVG